MNVGRVALLVGVAVLVLVANVAASILYMVVYGHIIDPGHDPQYYNDHIQVAGPYAASSPVSRSCSSPVGGSRGGGGGRSACGRP